MKGVSADSIPWVAIINAVCYVLHWCLSCVALTKFDFGLVYLVLGEREQGPSHSTAPHSSTTMQHTQQPQSITVSRLPPSPLRSLSAYVTVLAKSTVKPNVCARG